MGPARESERARALFQLGMSHFWLETEGSLSTGHLSITATLARRNTESIKSSVRNKRAAPPTPPRPPRHTDRHEHSHPFVGHVWK